MRAMNGAVRSLALLFTMTLGCGASSQSLSRTAGSCPAGRTLLDGVCVAEPVADYVACVRAQGAQLGGSRKEQISADAGALGIRVGAAAEVSESLEKKYVASDAAMLEIVRRCSASMAPGAASTAAVPDVTGTWKTVVSWENGRQHADVTVTFTQKGSDVVGVFYLPNEGRITGRLQGTELRGAWSRPPHAGHIELKFDAQGASFQGTYGDTPQAADTWTGRRQ